MKDLDFNIDEPSTHTNTQIIKEAVDLTEDNVKQSQDDIKQSQDDIEQIKTDKVTMQKVDTGWINTSDWTNRHLGSINLNYNNLVGTFKIGETITEATSGFTGIVMTDSGTVLILRNVTGGFFTTGRQITGGTSGATADVNGNTKNVDTNFYHGFGITELKDMRYELYISIDGTVANSFMLDINQISPSAYGGAIYWIDTNNIKLQTGSNGFIYLSDIGVGIGILSQDWYYKIVGCYFS